jgi:hypothetical protein
MYPYVSQQCPIRHGPHRKHRVQQLLNATRHEAREPEKTAVARHRLGKRDPAATNADALKLLDGDTHKVSAHTSLLAYFHYFEKKKL